MLLRNTCTAKSIVKNQARQLYHDFVFLLTTFGLAHERISSDKAGNFPK